MAIRSPCCKKWFDCAECHAEKERHPLLQSMEMVFACKKCKKCFRKVISDWDERYVVGVVSGATRAIVVWACRDGEYADASDAYL